LDQSILHFFRWPQGHHLYQVVTTVFQVVDQQTR
jgi:hypothetical protein